ncbi:glycosyltransferase family 4 protein [Streptomyces sp. NPDC059740]|uniref:glycosyltransferase family 4 protein n=1 Tax=Streptomyces sp. NPDC059740 TaxID=3346926 RepID=UPI003660E3A7
MKIVFLIHNVYGVGGTIRTTLNLAATLADTHQVEIVSMFRHRDTPRFAIDERIRVIPLVDLRPNSPDLDDPHIDQLAEVFPREEKRHRQYSRLNDLRIERYLRASDADVLIGTRPGVNVYLARFGPRRAVRVAQEHLTHDAHSKRLRTVLAHHYRKLDAVVTTTEADAAVYRSRMKLPGVHVAGIPNSVPEPGISPADGTAKVIAAAGRLTRSKRFDLVIDAFADVAAKHPDWSLRIYGEGAEKARLQELVDHQGLSTRVALLGFRSPIEAEFAQASIVVSASDAESFGMTLVEAMRVGVPVVSTNCPLGPAEIIQDRVDGRLVPTDDREAMAAALLELVDDDTQRRQMGQAALRSAHRFDPDHIAALHENLFAHLRATRSARGRARSRAMWRGRARRLIRRLRRLGP